MIESALLLALALAPNSNMIGTLGGPSQRVSIEPNDIRNSNVIAQLLPIASSNGFRFEWVGCGNTEGSSEPYSCNFLIESLHNDERQLSLYARSSGPWASQMVDSQGHQINAVSARLGSDNDDRAADAVLTPGVPIRGTVYFESAPEGQIKLIDLDCFLHGPGGRSFSVKFTES